MVTDLWCRNSVYGPVGELKDTAYTELEKLVDRKKIRLFNEQVIAILANIMLIHELLSYVVRAEKEKKSLIVACYYACYGSEHASKQAPVLSLL